MSQPRERKQYLINEKNNKVKRNIIKSKRNLWVDFELGDKIDKINKFGKLIVTKWQIFEEY
jgi:hypothetical protein